MLRYGVGMVVLLSANMALADVSAAQREEVHRLLQFIQYSNCTIERNGSRHKASKAVSHVQKKYDHFRDRIRTTEDFISYAATKSLMSGRHYLVKCGNGRKRKTRDWLLQELKRIRQGI